MKEQFKISAKVLSAMALEDYCPRCFYIKLKSKIPWQIFPGIFASIDSYTKKVLHYMIDQAEYLNNPKSFLSQYGKIKRWHKAPHWSKFQLLYKDLNIILSGEMDCIFEMMDNSFIIDDNKTAKYTKNQDALLPMYKVQLNCYKAICEGTGLFHPISGLFLTYFEPQTEQDDAENNALIESFDMNFKPKIISVESDHSIVGKLLEDVRSLYDMAKPPAGRPGCKDCEALDEVIKIVGR